ncbi:putative esterase [Luteitalea pratensis]|uniref:Putative esterase n=1 Tax=Luteitalea pratensis TaxID=1855912 RepID=A0A143PV59_LUTPR|nr:dienelactone hydrolase family protein [Luteitalea pratensis]AMY12053.1 putative esterase [Luteitalea pratensis]
MPAPGGTLTAAVARPPGEGPFPVLVLLHGTHGIAREYVRFAQDVSRESAVVAVAGCWFRGGQGAGMQFVTPIACPDAPDTPAATSDEALEIVGALVTAVRERPGVRGDRVALFGQSRGGGAALHYVFERGGVWVAVLNSTGYPQEVVDRAGAVSAPLLLLHGKADSPADGGSERTAVDRARKFEHALRREGKPVKAVYFDGGHNGLFADAKHYDESVRLIAAFLKEYLAKVTWTAAAAEPGAAPDRGGMSAFSEFELPEPRQVSLRVRRRTHNGPTLPADQESRWQRPKPNPRARASTRTSRPEPSPEQLADCKAIMAMCKRVTKQQPKMWGPSIVGSYTYRYESGHSGDAFLTGFAVRGKELVVSVCAENPEQVDLLARLGRHKMGKVCLYFKGLADLDVKVLEALIAGSVAEVRCRYPQPGDA